MGRGTVPAIFILFSLLVLSLSVLGTGEQEGKQSKCFFFYLEAQLQFSIDRYCFSF